MHEKQNQLVEQLLKEAEQAAANEDWATVRSRAENVFRFDPTNQQANDLLALPDVQWLINNPPELSLNEKLLHEAAHAAAQKDWATAKARTEQVLRNDPENVEAKQYWEMQRGNSREAVEVTGTGCVILSCLSGCAFLVFIPTVILALLLWLVAL